MLALGECGRVAGLAADVEDSDPLDEPRQRRGDRRIEPAHGLRAAEDQDRRKVRRNLEPGTRRLPGRSPSRRGSGSRFDRPARRRRRALGRRRRTTPRARRPAGPSPGRPARDRVALPQDDRDPERGGGEEDRDRHVAAGGQDRRGPSAARIAAACGIDSASRTGSRTVLTDRSTVRRERRASRRTGCPRRGRGRPRGHDGRPPRRVSGSTSGRSRSERATARAG